MPQVRKLSVEEVQTIERKNKGQRKMIEEEYDSFLDGYGAGDYGEAMLESNEKRITVRNRLKAAASRNGMTLEFRRTKGDTLRFRILSTGGAPHTAVNGSAKRNGSAVVEEEPVSSEATPEAPRKRGRRKKSES